MKQHNDIIKKDIIEKDIINLLQEIKSAPTFTSKLLEHIYTFNDRTKNNIKKTERDIIKTAKITDSNYSKIKNKKITVSKRVAFSLSLALELNLDEVKEFIGLAGFTFMDDQILDIAVKKFIEKGIYDIDKLNDYLNVIYEKDCFNNKHYLFS